MKRPGHKNFNAVSHNRSRPEVLFLNLTWRSRGQISSVLLQLLLFVISNRKLGRHGKWSLTFWQWEKQHLGPHVVVGYGIKIFWPGLFITSPDHLEGLWWFLPTNAYNPQVQWYIISTLFCQPDWKLQHNQQEIMSSEQHNINTFHICFMSKNTDINFWKIQVTCSS